MSAQRSDLRMVNGLLAPPLTVGSLADTMHSVPFTTPIPATMLAPTLYEVPQAARGHSSKKGESGSRSSSTRCLASNFPRLRWRST